MSAAAQKKSPRPPAILYAGWADNDNEENPEEILWKKRHSFDFSRSVNYIIHNKQVQDFALGAFVGVGGMLAKSAFTTAAHATGASLLIVVGAGVVGLGKATFKQCRENGFNLKKWDWKDLFKTTALATIGGAVAVYGIPALGDVVEKISDHFNFNIGNAFSGIMNFFRKPDISLPVPPVSLPAPPVEMPSAELPESIPAPIEAPLEAPAEVAADVEVPAVSEQWREIEALAESGNAQAKKDMAMSLLSGVNGFEADTARAMELYAESFTDGNTQAAHDLRQIAELNYRGMGDAAREILEQAAAADVAVEDVALENIAPENITAENISADIAAAPVPAPPAAGTELSMQFWQNADGEFEGVIHNAAGIIAPGTVVEIPVSRINAADFN